MTARAALLCGLALATAPGLAAKTAVAAESIDDPKLTRRLGTRVSLPGDPHVAADPAASPAPAPGADPGEGSVAVASGPVESIARRPEPVQPARTRVPHVKLGFRRFDFVRIGATDLGSTSGTPASEPFDSLSLDFYPVSSFVRFGLTTQYGWQSGTFRASGDYLIAQSFSLGVQLPRDRFVPFAEAFGGGGYMRRLQFDRTIPTVYWHMGLDVGTELFVSRHAYVSFALGYLHPVNGFATAQTSSSSISSASFTTVFVDTWSFKLGVGI